MSVTLTVIGIFSFSAISTSEIYSSSLIYFLKRLQPRRPSNYCSLTKCFWILKNGDGGGLQKQATYSTYFVLRLLPVVTGVKMIKPVSLSKCFSDELSSSRVSITANVTAVRPVGSLSADQVTKIFTASSLKCFIGSTWAQFLFFYFFLTSSIFRKWLLPPLNEDTSYYIFQMSITHPPSCQRKRSPCVSK